MDEQYDGDHGVNNPPASWGVILWCSL